MLFEDELLILTERSSLFQFSNLFILLQYLVITWSYR